MCCRTILGALAVRVFGASGRICWTRCVRNRRLASAHGRTTANQELSFGRFLDHSSVSYNEMLITAVRFTGHRAIGRHVLAIQDTTEFNFPGHAASKRGFGRSGNDRDLGLRTINCLHEECSAG
jgi:hypothetical protein